MGDEELRYAFKSSVSTLDDDVDWVCTSNIDDPAGEMAGDEDFDVVLHLLTKDFQRAREIVGNAGGAISDRDDWDQELEFEVKHDGTPEIDLEVYVYLTPESRKIARGTRLYF